MDNNNKIKFVKNLNNNNIENISDNCTNNEENITNSNDKHNNNICNCCLDNNNNNNSNHIKDIFNINNDIIDVDINLIDLLKKLIINNKSNIIDSLKNILQDEDTNEEYNINDEEIKYKNYIKNLSKKERINILKMEYKIKKYNTINIPLKAKIINLPIDISIRSNILDKYDQLIDMKTSNGEYYKLNKYINGIFKIPFDNYIKIPITLNNKSIDIINYFDKIKYSLDSSIYGQTKTKNILLELIAKWITNPKSYGNVIGLCGPPGIGKTTIIKHGLAKALNIPFSFIPLGGTTSSSFLIGHDYTYEGSTWGKIVSIIIEKKCMNPIIFFDELDKVSDTKEGEEIIGTLTHLTDTTQNSTFYDRYYNNIPLDLSKAIFIFSFNDDKKINPILKDRINIVHLDGFNTCDKIEIVKKYSINTICNNIGISYNNYKFDDITIKYIINNFTEEKGVRNLNRCIEKILMKLNFIRLNGNKINNIKIEYPIIINIDLINKFLKDINKPNDFFQKNMYI